MWILSNGTHRTEDNNEGVIVIEQSYNGKQYLFDSDIFYDISALCSQISDGLLKRLFDEDEYYNKIALEPWWFLAAGIDSELTVSKEGYEAILADFKGEEKDEKDDGVNCEITEYKNAVAKMFTPISKYIYLYDLRTFLSHIQNDLLLIQQNFIDFYTLLVEENEMEAHIEKVDDIKYHFISGGATVKIYNALNAIIITCNSVFDLLAKLLYEVRNMESVFGDKIVKFKSGHTLFCCDRNDRCTKGLSKENSIFESNRSIKIFTELRNELVHNSTWQSVNKIYYKYENGKLVEKFILMPDFDETGKLVRSGNRNRFFSQGNKINILLPEMLQDIFKRIYATLELINSTLTD